MTQPRTLSPVVVVSVALLSCSSSGTEQTPTDSPPPPPAADAVEPSQQPGELETADTADEVVRWRGVEIAEGCELRMAENPSAFDLQLDWKPCPDGPPGCRETSTYLGDDLFDGTRHLWGATHDGEVSIIASFSLPGPILKYAVAPLDGAPFVAVEQPPDAGCSVGVGRLSSDGGVLEVVYGARGGFASRAYLRGPLKHDPSWTRVAARLLRKDFPGYIGEAELSIGGNVAIAASGGPVRWFDPKTEKWMKVPGSRGGWACCFEGHGDYLTFMIENIPERVMAARLGEPARELRPVVKGGGTSPVAVDGQRAVWCEGRGRDKNNIYDRVELWTGEITPDLGIANERMVTRLPLDRMPRLTFNGGMAVVSLFKRGEVDRLAVVRVSDGETRVLDAPEGLRNERLLWITESEIGVMVGPGGNHLGPSRICRLPIGSLPLLPASAGEETK